MDRQASRLAGKIENMNELKALFRKLTPLELATREMVDAERSKLQADSAKEYAEALSGYSAARIKRLKQYIATATKETI